MKSKEVRIIGAGLAGSEAAWQCALRGITVHLYEMKPIKRSPAHHSDTFAELVCSNSLRSNQLSNGVGLLKEELRMMNSIIMQVADETRVPAGSSLAVDREAFAELITKRLSEHPLIHIHHEVVDELDESVETIIATGPLTDEGLAEFIQKKFNHQSLYFYDAAAPIIDVSTIDFSIVYYKSRYDKGNSQDYINCPMTQAQFELFYNEVLTAQRVFLHDFEKEIYFEGCMPFEVMAERGKKTLLFGPMKPVGLEHEGKRPYAVVQLRQDNAAASLYNMVGFQTHLTWPEQKRIIQLIPGLENATITRYGVMHRNTYLRSPEMLDSSYQSKQYPNWFFAGQITGVEGYIESCASGLVAGINMSRRLNDQTILPFPATTMIGALANYICSANPDHFQPMNANFGILVSDIDQKNKQKREIQIELALSTIRQFKEQL